MAWPLLTVAVRAPWRAARPAALGALSALALLAGCAIPPAPASSPYQLQLRASFDLACPAAWVRVYQLDERARGADGCGRRLTYVESCELVRGAERCTWLADAASVLERASSSGCPAHVPSSAASVAPPRSTPSGVAPLGSAPPPAQPMADPFADRH